MLHGIGSDLAAFLVAPVMANGCRPVGAVRRSRRGLAFFIIAISAAMITLLADCSCPIVLFLFAGGRHECALKRCFSNSGNWRRSAHRVLSKAATEKSPAFGHVAPKPVGEIAELLVELSMADANVNYLDYFTESYEWDVNALRADVQKAREHARNPTMRGIPRPSGEVAELLAELLVAAGDADYRDYWVDDDGWDVDGLRDDVKVQRKRDQIEKSHAPRDPPISADDTIVFSILERLVASEWLPGEIHDVSLSGVLVNLALFGKGSSPLLIQGIVPLYRVSDTPADTLNKLAVGQKVHVRVVDFNSDPGVVVLSMKGGEADIRADLEAQLYGLRQRYPDISRRIEFSSSAGRSNFDYPVSHIVGPLPDRQDVSAFASMQADEWIRGVVHHSASFGVYITVVSPDGTCTAWGLVHLTELDGNIGSRLTEFSEGQEVPVRVIGVDESMGTILLSMREAAI